MKNRGVTLIELSIVIAVVGILVSVLSIDFLGWREAYKVETQVKDIYADLMDARVRAMRVNRVHFVSLTNSNSYTMYDDDSDGTNPLPDGDGTLQTTGDTEIPSFPKTVEYDLNWGGASPTNVIIDFNTRGIIQPALTPLGGTICLFTDYNGDGESDSNPDYDCIIISRTRINIGKLNSQVSGDCDAAHCIAK